MKTRSAGLVITILLAAVLAGAVTAQTEPLFDPYYEDRCFNGFEVDLQIGVPSPLLFGADFGFLTRGYFNLGLGGSFAVIDGTSMGGGYAKIGLLTYDILEAKLLVGECISDVYGEFKAKLSLPIYIRSHNVIWPASVGVKVSALKIGRSCLRQITPFFGVNVVVNPAQTEVWVELQFPQKYSRCGLGHPTPHLEFGFATYL